MGQQLQKTDTRVPTYLMKEKGEDLTYLKAYIKMFIYMALLTNLIANWK